MAYNPGYKGQVPDLAEPEPIPLDEMFARAMQQRTARDRLREATRESRAHPPEAPEGREANRLAKELLLQLEWVEEALVCLVLEQVCTCGRSHFWVEGEYIQYRHRRDATARWQIIHRKEHVRDIIRLPRQIEYRTHNVDLCPSCVREHGY